jgi:phosphohistidine swiveling domain-containing protein
VTIPSTETTETTETLAPPAFPVAWPDPADAALFWQQDPMHFPDPVAPMEAAMLRDHLERGFTFGVRAYEAPIERVAVRAINGYHYQAMVPVLGTPEEMELRGQAAEAAIGAVIGRMGDFWTTDVLPEIQGLLRDWERFDLAGATRAALVTHLDDTWAISGRLWELHFLTVLPVYLAISEFDELYRGLFPDSGPLDSYKLLEGLPNMTVEVGQALWQLSRRALASNQVREALGAGDAAQVTAALDGSEAGRAFLGELDAYLARYGRRADKWTIAAPSWIEDPTPVIESLRDFMARGEDDAPAITTQTAAAGREAAIARARARLAGYPAGVVGQFEAMLAAAQVATVITEDHNFWIDNTTIHHTRQVLLEAGRRLVADGTLGAADDVLFLDPEELRAALAQPGAELHGAVARRRALLEAQQALQPPPVLGTTPPAPPAEDAFGRFVGKFFGTPPAPAEHDGELRGAPGSAGVVRGTARVIRSITEAHRLQPGDILVAQTTAPPWTPLFATVGGVVTDTGGALSHCAVVAREYGIPAVVGAAMASTVIRDGQMVEVDGTAGVVRIV